MSRLMRKLATVNQWSDTDYDNTKNCLEYMFTDAAYDGTSQTAGNVFSAIYIPVRSITDAQGTATETYEKIGYTIEELARIYKTYYGENFLIEAYKEDNGTYPYATAAHEMRKRVLGVLLANKAKYLKLVELQGYKYNPLWNVDGSETFTYLENNGTNDVKTVKSYGTDGQGQHTGWTDSHTHTNTWSGSVNETDTRKDSHQDKHSVTAFDSDTLKTSYQDEGWNKTSIDGEGTSTKTTTYNQRTDSTNDTTTYGYHKDEDETTITHNNAKNIDSQGAQADYTATDVYGNDIKGGDKFHTEKRVREGNIGVTQTQELIRNERENLKFSIIMEFFKDLNEQVLVGIY